MKKLVNVRLPVLLALAITAGIGLGYLFVDNGVSAFYIIAVIPLTAVIFILTTIFSKSKFASACLLLCALFFTVGAVNCFFRFNENGETGADLFLFSHIRSAVRVALYDNLDRDIAGIAYGMLTGDTRGIDGAAMSAFRYGGIAHIFAVSGLHIGIIYGIVNLICKKLKQNKYLSCAVCIFTVFFYSGVCGFTLSSVRAAIMCAVASAAKLTYKKYDGLNSLALSVVMILIVTPQSLFSVGFQLSVCAVCGIVLLSKQLMCLLKRLPRKLAEGISVCVSAQAATLPVLLANFGYISGAGLMLNLVVVPVLSVIFVFLFICTLIAVILPFSAFYIVQIAALPLEAVVSFFLDAGLENVLISGFGTGAFAPIYFIGLLTLSDKVNLKPVYRASALFSTACALCAYSIVFN